MLGLILSFSLVALFAQSCMISSESTSTTRSPSATAESLPPELRAFAREAGFLLGYIAGVQGVISACDSRLSRKPTYQSSLDTWQASNESLWSEVKAIKKRLGERPVPVFIEAAVARVEHESREKTQKELWALSLKEAKAKCDSTEERLGGPNGVYQQIRAQLDVVTKAEQALINLSSE